MLKEITICEYIAKYNSLVYNMYNSFLYKKYNNSKTKVV